MKLHAIRPIFHPILLKPLMNFLNEDILSCDSSIFILFFVLIPFVLFIETHTRVPIFFLCHPVGAACAIRGCDSVGVAAAGRFFSFNGSNASQGPQCSAVAGWNEVTCVLSLYA